MYMITVLEVILRLFRNPKNSTSRAWKEKLRITQAKDHSGKINVLFLSAKTKSKSGQNYIADMLGIGLTNGNVPKADTRESSSSALHQCNIISYNILNTSGTREPCETSDTSLTIETSETSDASQTLMVMCPKQTPVSLLPLHCTSAL